MPNESSVEEFKTKKLQRQSHKQLSEKYMFYLTSCKT